MRDKRNKIHSMSRITRFLLIHRFPFLLSYSNNPIIRRDIFENKKPLLFRKIFLPMFKRLKKIVKKNNLIKDFKIQSIDLLYNDNYFGFACDTNMDNNEDIASVILYYKRLSIMYCPICGKSLIKYKRQANGGYICNKCFRPMIKGISFTVSDSIDIDYLDYDLFKLHKRYFDRTIYLNNSKLENTIEKANKKIIKKLKLNRR